MKKTTLLAIMLIISSLSFGQFLTEDFESGTFPPSGWTISTTNPSFTWQTSTNANNGSTGSAEVQYDPALVAQNETLISPAMDFTAAVAPEATLFINMSYFWAVSPNDNYDVTISARQGTTTTPLWSENDLGVFTSFTWIEVSLDLSAYAGQNNVFLEINYTGTDGASLNIDDIIVEEAPACDIANNLAFTSFTDTTADITWDNVGNFNIEFGEFPYTQGGTGGTNITVTAANSYQFTSLTPGVSYDVFITQDCGSGLVSGTETITIGTTPGTVNTYPYSEDLEPAANQALILNLGVSFGTATTQAWAFNLDNLTDGDTTNDFANSGTASFVSGNTFTDADTDATLFFGPFDLTASANYDFSLSQRVLDVASATRPNQDMEFIYASTIDGTTNTVIATFDDMNNTTYQLRSGSFVAPSSGEFFIGVRDKSSVLTGVTMGNAIFIDDISLNQTLSVTDIGGNEVKLFYDILNDELKVELSEGNISHVSIYNLLGQQIINNEVNSNNTSISMSNNTDGIYIARVTSNGSTKSVKFIKN